MASDYQTGLAAHAATLPRWSIQRRRINTIVNMPEDDPRKQHALVTMEEHTRRQLGIDDTAEVDWTQGAVNGGLAPIDWNKILQLIMTILPLIIKIITGA